MTQLALPSRLSMDGKKMEVEFNGDKEKQHSDLEDKSEKFPCRARHRRITIRRCLEDFTDVHALRDKTNVCFQCRQGAGHRVEFAFNVEATEQRIDAIIAISSTQGIQPWMWRCLKVSNIAK